MKVQIISNSNLSRLESKEVSISQLSKPLSLDEFDVNIIDLSTDSLWRNTQRVPTSINSINDLISIRRMVERKDTSTAIYVFPHNCLFHYSYSPHFRDNNGYQQEEPIKDCLPEVSNVISKALPFPITATFMIYENTTTIINDVSYSASFYFEDGYRPITKSNKSSKTTTIDFSGAVFLTTLQILESSEKLMGFLRHILPPSPHEEIPQWAAEIKVLNDEDLLFQIDNAMEEIRQLNLTIDEANAALYQNARIKSILYTNSTELVEVVFTILEKLLACDLSEFVDEKKEDFQIKKDTFTLIGEIKGVTSNIKNEHISQVDVHFQGYLDKLAEDGIQENVHQVLIMNPFRNKPLSEREPVHDTQIKLAERNSCLIIETTTLLKLYEKFVSGDIDVPACEKLFIEKTGLLKQTDF